MTDELGEIFGLDVDPFNVAEEYVPDPLVPDGMYQGIITNVVHKKDINILEFTISFQGNEGINCIDNITPIDGKTSKYALWLPRKGDELVPSKFSALTVRQDRIRTIKKFSEKMTITIGTENDIKQAIESQLWLSIPVYAQVKSRLYEGELYNHITKLERIKS